MFAVAVRMAKSKADKQSKKAAAKAKAKALSKLSRTEEGAVTRVLLKEFMGLVASGTLHSGRRWQDSIADYSVFS